MNKIKNYLLSLVFLVVFVDARGQEQFTVHVVPSALTAMPTVHSGAFAEWNGKWIMIGGRKEGLHDFQSGIAFASSGRNDSIFVIDPVNNVRWSSYAGSLSTDLFESICSTNMEFYQDSSTLYMIGGFGRQDGLNTWTTFPLLTAIDLNGLSNAVINGTGIASFFRQLTDSNLAVTGGHLERIDSTYYLVFGQRFDGNYSSTSGSPLFSQQYTNEIRTFNIHDDGTLLSIANFSTIQDTTNFHRRDYNLVPQLFTNGDYGFTAFGGVFQKFANLPYLDPIDITSSGLTYNASFNQDLNQYETASMPVYDSSYNFMHTIFFGGISMYTIDTSTQSLVADSLIPFVSTISKVSRDASGNLAEYNLPVQMPALLGTNARFVPEPTIPLFHNNIIDLNPLTGNTLVGKIISGIQSDLPNVSTLDPASMSRPNAQVFDVYIDKSPSAVAEHVVRNAIHNLLVYPNPSTGTFNIKFSLEEVADVDVSVYNVSGKKIATLFSGFSKKGSFLFSWDGSRAIPGTYLCRIKSGRYNKTVKMELGK